MEVRILGINGSPRNYGNSYKLLSVALKAAEKEGAKTELVNLYDYKINPCVGCLSDDLVKCKYPCIIEDEMKILYEKVLRSDGLIISSPVYWFGVSGHLKNFIDRLTVFENMIYVEGRCWVEGKVVGLIAVGADSGHIQLISNLMATFNSMGMVVPPWALAYATTNGDVLEIRNAVLDAANVGRSVAIMAKMLKKGNIVWYDSNLLGNMEDELKRVKREAWENKRGKVKTSPLH